MIRKDLAPIYLNLLLDEVIWELLSLWKRSSFSTIIDYAIN